MNPLLPLKSLLVLLAITVTAPVWSQVPQYTTPNPTSTGSNAFPFNSTTNKKTQYIYKPGDIVAAPGGLIDTIWFRNNNTASGTSAGPGTYSNLQIRLGQTSNLTFQGTGGLDFYPPSSLTTVINSPSYTINQTAPSGAWYYIPLPTPFPYDPTQSLIVDVEMDNRTSSSGFQSATFNVQSAPNHQRLTSSTNGAAQGSASAILGDFGISVAPLVGLEAAALRINSPIAPLTGGTLTPVTFDFQNRGTTNLVSATVGYQFNNNPPVIETWSGNLSGFVSTSHTFTTNLTLPASGSFTLKTWVTNANGIGDANSSNDTITRTFCIALAGGTYTIGGASGNFASISDAVNTINNCGINGSVVFNIAPGTYYGSFSMPSVAGSSSVNTITFASSTGLPADVTIIHDTATSATNRSQFTFGVPGKVTISGITFTRTVVPGVLAGCINFGNTTQGEVLNCVFNDLVESTSSVNVGILMAGSNGLITGNTFSGFYHGVQLNGPATALFSSLNQVLSNTFNRYTYRAIYALNQSDVSITGNTITNFVGTSTAGSGIWTANTYNAFVSGNRILGDMSASGILISNANADTTNFLLNTNKFFNNVISGQQAASLSTTTTLIPTLINVAGSFSATAVPSNPRDAVEIVNNTVIFNVNTTTTSTLSGGLYFTGGSATAPAYAFINLRNNHVEVNPISGSLPATFRLVRFTQTTIIDSLTSTNNNYQMGGATVPPFFRDNLAGVDHATVTAWQAATSRDAGSVSIAANFIAPTIPQPTNIALDNRGTPVSFVSTDIDNTIRSTTTPDIGAYEFVGSVFSTIAFTPLTDTLIGPNRLLSVSITDTASALIPGSARLFYKKASQSVWQLDTVPVVNGSQYTFTIDTTRLGGLRGLDVIQYYVAVRNATNTVTTSPLGGNGLYLSNQVVPPVLRSYQILPIATGTYRVGTSGPADFTTLTAAANFFNLAFIAGPVNFVLIDTLYASSTGETFPIVFDVKESVTSATPITLRPFTGVNATISGAPLGASSVLIFRSARFWTIDGSNNGTSSRNLTIVNTSSATVTSVVSFFTNAQNRTTGVNVRNTRIVSNSRLNLGSFGLYFGTNTLSTSGTIDSLTNVTIENNSFERAGTAIYLRGTTTVPANNVLIQGNLVGASSDTAAFIGMKGIDVQNIRQGRIINNEVNNMWTTTSATFVGIEVGGTGSDSVIVRRNNIHDIRTGYAALPAAHGINIIGGTNTIVDNNIIYGILGLNYSNISNLYLPAGIRITSGSGHRIHYNSVNLYGNHTNAATTNASSSAAFVVTSTAVTNLIVQNNIFSNGIRSSGTAQSFANAMWFPTSYSFSGSTYNNNAYHVDTSAQHAVVRVGTTVAPQLYTTVNNWRAWMGTQVATNETASVPFATNSLAPYSSNTNLTIPAGTTTGIESGAVTIGVLGSPNTDYTNSTRPAFGNAGPDMGAYEFNGIALPDQFPPIIDSVKINPDGNQCLPVSRTITVWARDNFGGRGVDSVRVNRTVNGIAQPTLLLARSTGTALNGVWTGTLPASANGAIVEFTVNARDSLGNSAPTTRPIAYQDDYLQLSVSNDTTILQGDTATLRATFQSGSPILITEVDLGGTDAFEIQNVSGSPVNVTGWKVVVSDSYTDINSVNTIVQTLSGTMNAGQTTTWSDASTATNYWGNNLFWNPGAFPSFTGWVMILKPNNEVADAMFWSWPASNIQAAAISVGGNPINLSGAWSGDGINTTTVPTGITVSRIGNRDNNDSTGFAFLTSSIGTTNPGLQLPLGGGNVQWTTLGGTVVDSVPVIKVTPSSTTTYIATITDGFCTKSDTVVVTVNPLVQNPDIGVSRIISPVAGSGHNGSQPVQVTVMLKNCGPVAASGFDVEYRVNGGSSIVTNSITTTLQPGDSLQHTFTIAWTPTSAGPVTLCANTTGMPGEINRSNDTVCVFLSSTISLEELALNNRLIGKVYPNPATTEVNFEFNEFTDKGILEVFDQLGRVVAQVELTRNDQSTYTLKTEDWAAGMYSYRLTTLTQLQTGKLVVRK